MIYDFYSLIVNHLLIAPGVALFCLAPPVASLPEGVADELAVIVGSGVVKVCSVTCWTTAGATRLRSQIK